MLNEAKVILKIIRKFGWTQAHPSPQHGSVLKQWQPFQNSSLHEREKDNYKQTYLYSQYLIFPNKVEAKGLMQSTFPHFTDRDSGGKRWSTPSFKLNFIFYNQESWQRHRNQTFRGNIHVKKFRMSQAHSGKTHEFLWTYILALLLPGLHLFFASLGSGQLEVEQPLLQVQILVVIIISSSVFHIW